MARTRDRIQVNSNWLEVFRLLALGQVTPSHVKSLVPRNSWYYEKRAEAKNAIFDLKRARVAAMKYGSLLP